MKYATFVTELYRSTRNEAKSRGYTSCFVLLEQTLQSLMHVTNWLCLYKFKQQFNHTFIKSRNFVDKLLFTFNFCLRGTLILLAKNAVCGLQGQWNWTKILCWWRRCICNETGFVWVCRKGLLFILNTQCTTLFHERSALFLKNLCHVGEILEYVILKTAFWLLICWSRKGLQPVNYKS